MADPARASRRHHPGAMEALWPWIIRFAGLALIFWETIVDRTDRPSLLVLAAVMVGLREFIRIERGHE